MKAPTAPPPLSNMAERKAKLEAERAELFPRWKALLEQTKGNMQRAGVEWTPPLNQNQATRLTRRLGLVEYAAELRVAGGLQGRSAGRPKGMQRPRKSKIIR